MKTVTQKLQTAQGRKNIFRALLTGITLSFVLYSFAIASTTLSISESKSYSQSMRDLQTELAELEVEYFDMINTLSLTEAQERGFNETASVNFAHVDKNTSVAYNF